MPAATAAEAANCRADAAANAAAECRLAVVVYSSANPPDAVLAAAVEKLQARGLRVGGLLQQAEGSGKRAELFARDIASGRRVRLFEDRGRKARGCRLDAAGLAEAASWLRHAIDAKPDVLFVNRFGRQETVGRGLVDEIGAAIVSDIPVVVPLAATLMPQWRRFAGEDGVRLKATSPERFCQELLTWLGAAATMDARDAA
jgi:nucleoside-triphosphatase THEP1